MNKVVLDVQDLKTYFVGRNRIVRAVDGVSFSLSQGEALGIVGESGSGKTITCLSLLKLVPKPAARIVGGKIIFRGEDIIPKSEAEMRKLRGSRISMILQDPMTSLNPAFNVGNQVAEPIKIHQSADSHSIKQRVIDILRRVNIPSPESRVSDFPHQLSGGMRQRVVGAMAISCQPDILIADEPTTALDATIQVQYLQLLKEIQKETNVSLIYVTHNFGIVARMCDRVAVMYAGRIVENAGVDEIFDKPRHPYTMNLMRCVPRIEAKVDRLETIDGKPPSLHDLPKGCAFAPRCEKAFQRCREEPPPEIEASRGWKVRCWSYN